MATRYKEFGRYVVEIKASIELKNGDAWRRYGWKHRRLFWQEKRLGLTMEVGDGARYWKPF